MSLLDQATDTVLVQVQAAAVDDEYGTPILGPATGDPVPVSCRVQPVSTEDLAGQATGATHRIIARTFPRGPFSSVTWDGREWELVGEPARHHGSSRTAHVSVDIKARSPEV